MSTRAQVDPSDFTGLADWVEDYGRLAVGDGRRPEIIAALRHAAGLQDRLATAEADADQLYDMLDTHWDGGACCNDWATEDDEVMQLHREAVARREQP